MYQGPDYFSRRKVAMNSCGAFDSGHFGPSSDIWNSTANPVLESKQLKLNLLQEQIQLFPGTQI